MTLDELLGVMIDEKFNIQGYDLSNPYVITYDDGKMVVKSIATNEDISSRALIELINGDISIEK